MVRARVRARIGVMVRARVRARVRFMYFQRPYIKFPSIECSMMLLMEGKFCVSCETT